MKVIFMTTITLMIMMMLNIDDNDDNNIGDGPPIRVVRLDGGGCLRDSVVR